MGQKNEVPVEIPNFCPDWLPTLYCTHCYPVHLLHFCGYFLYFFLGKLFLCLTHPPLGLFLIWRSSGQPLSSSLGTIRHPVSCSGILQHRHLGEQGLNRWPYGYWTAVLTTNLPYNSIYDRVRWMLLLVSSHPNCLHHQQMSHSNLPFHVNTLPQSTVKQDGIKDKQLWLMGGKVLDSQSSNRLCSAFRYAPAFIITVQQKRPFSAKKTFFCLLTTQLGSIAGG